MRGSQLHVRARRLEIDRELRLAGYCRIGARVVLLALRGHDDLHVLIFQLLGIHLAHGDGLLHLLIGLHQYGGTVVQARVVHEDRQAVGVGIGIHPDVKPHVLIRLAQVAERHLEVARTAGGNTRDELRLRHNLRLLYLHRLLHDDRTRHVVLRHHLVLIRTAGSTGHCHEDGTEAVRSIKHVNRHVVILTVLGKGKARGGSGRCFGISTGIEGTADLLVCLNGETQT